jgi:hypothetical protein|tara:strand:- start:6755 stop:6994 length:240 start_codon:yes stop_codon:yes gene_type:complete
MTATSASGTSKDGNVGIGTTVNMRKEIELEIDKDLALCEKLGIDPKTGEPKPAPRGWAYAETSVENNPVLPANFPTTNE